LVNPAKCLSLAVILLSAACAVPSAKDANVAKAHFDQGKAYFFKKEYGIKEFLGNKTGLEI